MFERLLILIAKSLALSALDMKRDPTKGYEGGFLWQPDKDTACIKIIHNGRALNAIGLTDAVKKQLESYSITDLKVAFVEGD